MPSLDDPGATYCHAAVIKEKRLLRSWYERNYTFFREIASTCPQGIRLELGSGGGFLKEYIPDVITSDYMPLSMVEKVISATELPFDDASLSCVFAHNVLHHLANIDAFLCELDRCLKPGGCLIAVEPATTPFSHCINSLFSHEPFNLHHGKDGDWRLEEKGPLSTANMALPSIVFQRDRHLFIKRHPRLHIELLRNFNGFTYLASGGITHGRFAPDFTCRLFQRLDSITDPLRNLFGLHFQLILRSQGQLD